MLEARYPDAPSAADRLHSALFYPLPHHAVSRVVHAATRWRARWWKDALIRAFMGRFGVDLSDAEVRDPGAYPDFNRFFTRALRPDARPLPVDPASVACPADGTASALGALDGGEIIQAKGQRFTAAALLADDAAAERFHGGSFLTVYLSPRDYHRVHIPATATLRRMTHIPGRLFSVAPYTVRAVPGLFARNERVAALFDTERGPLAVVMVGAICVASIETVWAGEITPPAGRTVRAQDYEPGAVRLERGAEMGRFNMGSTVITLFGPGMVEWDDGLEAGQKVRMGQAVGRFRD